MRRRQLPAPAVIAAALVVLAGGGAAYVVSQHGAGGRNHAQRPPVTAPLTVRPAVLGTTSTTAPMPTPAGVNRALARLVSDPGLGGSLSAYVVDQSTGQPVYARTPGRALPPASTAKLLTAVAAIEALGAGGTLRTVVRQAGSTLYLVGGGDVTLTSGRSPGYPAAASLIALARAAAAAQPGNAPVSVCPVASLWSGPPRAPGWSTSYFTDGDIAQPTALEVDEGRLRPDEHPRSSTPALQAVAKFAALMTSDGVAAKVGSSADCGSAPANTGLVASASSAPVEALVQRMLTDSDNDLAEALGRAVALHDGDTADFAGEARAITARVRALVGAADALTLYDASGLSRLDRVDAHLLVAVLKAATSAQHPELRAVSAGLPVAGLTGTLADRFRRPPASAGAGVVRAKTGNLIGVNTLAGLVVDSEGRALLFAFLTADARSPQAGESALDRLAARLSACGCG